MIQLVYVSSATRLFTDAQIADILATSRRNNGRDGITGVLLYKTGSVIQVLEGGEAEVHLLFEKIKADTRHRQVTLIYERPIDVREFSSWAMGFRLLATAFGALPEGAWEIRELVANVSAQPSARARCLLATFDGSVR